jgi:hypothetical protein
LAELEWQGEPDQPSLRRAIRHRLRHFDPTLRVIAEGFLAETSQIDLLAVGAEGEIVSIRIAASGDDAAALTRSLADLSWLRPRTGDFLKLAPGLGLEPSAEPRALLLCPDFGNETRAAVENLPRRTIELLGYRYLRQHGQLSVIFETWKPTGLPPATSRTGRPAHEPGLGSHAQPNGDETARLTDPPSSSSFRTGLTDADLRLEH